MVTEDYCSFEVAKLLKEKGFDEPCDNYYDQSSDEPQQLTLDEMYYSYDEFLKVPTHQMAMKWLREVHNRFVEVCADKGYDFKSIVFRPAVYDKDLDCLWGSDNYKSYEQAVEAALKHCLKNLI